MANPILEKLRDLADRADYAELHCLPRKEGMRWRVAVVVGDRRFQLDYTIGHLDRSELAFDKTEEEVLRLIDGMMEEMDRRRSGRVS